ncbi:MAG TPA: tRNA (adenosine(37)-N6)-threonylcarbamoyltransferase complex transferase subunit TsaD [Spirochaetota bacterium]|nr:tRNA (adenosine(37)-N6)-threonylcarbamoyltransferase complex transferase subunit TsaD [Spirochaetota bacterium]
MKNGSLIGLGFESSCDETSVSVISGGKKILSNIISSQIDIHRAYNGVVPEIASRAHLEVVNSITREAMMEADVTFGDIDYVGATSRPGLVGSLLIAVQSAKAVSYACSIPLVCVNHLEAHLTAAFIENDELEYPFIGLLVSGGNTALFEVRGIGQMRLLGRSSDDSVGEAYDKVSKFLGLGYPGGPVIDNLARQAEVRKELFPKILAKYEDYSFSYSGLKTAVINYFKENPDADVREVVYAFQERALEILIRRTFAASRDLDIPRIVIAGGVAANSRLRELVTTTARGGEKAFFPSPILCTDNAAMVAITAHRYFECGITSGLDADVSPRAQYGVA